jgi:hypothetical protein
MIKIMMKKYSILNKNLWVIEKKIIYQEIVKEFGNKGKLKDNLVLMYLIDLISICGIGRKVERNWSIALDRGKLLSNPIYRNSQFISSINQEKLRQTGWRDQFLVNVYQRKTIRIIIKVVFFLTWTLLV